MLRRLLNLLTLLSLLLSLSAVVLWVRSYWTIDIVKLGSQRLYKAASGGGGVMLESLQFFHREGNWRTGMDAAGRLSTYAQTREDYLGAAGASDGGPGRRWDRIAYPYTNRSVFWNRAWASVLRPAWPRMAPLVKRTGVTYDNDTGVAVEQWFIGRALWLPYWIPAAAFAVAPAVSAARTTSRRRRRQRLKKGLCPNCGYDLRASSGRCPECGAPAPVPTPVHTAV